MAAVLVGIPVAVVLFADLLGLGGSTPFVQVIAFRPQLAAGVLLLAVVAGLLGRPARPLALVLALIGLLGVLVVLPRAVGGPAPASGGTPFDVLTINTHLGRADPAAIAGLVREHRPAVVVLPEANQQLRDPLMREPGLDGYQLLTANRSGDDSPIAVLVDRDLGSPQVSVDRDGKFPAIVVTLARPLAGLRVVATHPQSPKPGDVAPWRRDVTHLSRWCAEGPPTIVAGELNPSFDHAELRAGAAGCTDSASSVGAGLTGTWPSALPAVLGAQIDHVLVARGPRPVSAEVLDVPGSDHRGLLARLTVGP